VVEEAAVEIGSAAATMEKVATTQTRHRRDCRVVGPSPWRTRPPSSRDAGTGAHCTNEKRPRDGRVCALECGGGNQRTEAAKARKFLGSLASRGGGEGTRRVKDKEVKPQRTST
jgi:hypothetical protein